MDATVRVSVVWDTLYRYPALAYVCASIGLLMAAFLASLHWIVLVASVVIGVGGPSLVAIAWDIVHRTGPTDVASTEKVRPTDTFKQVKRRRWSSECSFFFIGTGVMNYLTFLALSRVDVMWYLLLGFSLPLFIFGIRGTIRTRGNST